MRRKVNASQEQPWINGNTTNGIAGVEASYNGEENVTQLRIDTSKLTGASTDSSTQYFDEPLTVEQVLSIVDPFIK